MHTANIALSKININQKTRISFRDGLENDQVGAELRGIVHTRSPGPQIRRPPVPCRIYEFPRHPRHQGMIRNALDWLRWRRCSDYSDDFNDATRSSYRPWHLFVHRSRLSSPRRTTRNSSSLSSASSNTIEHALRSDSC